MKIAIVLVLLAAAIATAQPFNPGVTPVRNTTTVLVPLTEAETQTLQFMREEEKLARDVYRALYQKWNLTVFANISAAEQSHFDAIGTLLTRYGVADPAANNPAGIYTNPALIALYNDIMAKASVSAQEALAAGTVIEKKDIGDLEAALQSTAKLDLKRVYTNLLNASFNHLEAFETICELLVTAN